MANSGRIAAAKRAIVTLTPSLLVHGVSRRNAQPTLVGRQSTLRMTALGRSRLPMESSRRIGHHCFLSKAHPIAVRCFGAVLAAELGFTGTRWGAQAALAAIALLAIAVIAVERQLESR